MAKAIKKAKRKLYQAKEWAVVAKSRTGDDLYFRATSRAGARRDAAHCKDFGDTDIRVMRVSIREIPERRAR